MSALPPARGKIETLRLFYALWPDGAARRRLAAIAADVANAGHGRATAGRKLHVTLAFLGNVAIARLDELRAAGAQASAGVGAIDLALDTIGGAHGGELVWIAPAQLPAALVALHARLDEALGARGFAVERREFRPHVTLARRCARRMRHAPVAAVAFTVDRLTLMASATTDEGSEYREVGGWPLA